MEGFLKRILHFFLDKVCYLLYRLGKNFVLGNFMDEAVVTRNIKELRQKRRITLEKLASITRLSKGYLCKIEKSKKAPPSQP